MYTTMLYWNAHVRIRCEAAIFHWMDDVYIADGLRRTIIIQDNNNITLNKENRKSIVDDIIMFSISTSSALRFSKIFSQVHFVAVSWL